MLNGTYERYCSNNLLQYAQPLSSTMDWTIHLLVGRRNKDPLTRCNRHAMSISGSRSGPACEDGFLEHAGEEVQQPVDEHSLRVGSVRCLELYNKPTLQLVQIVERLIGYKRSNCALFPLILLSCVSGGSVWIVIWIAAYLFPQTVLWRMQECSLLEAQYVLAKVRSGRAHVTRCF